MSRNSCKSIPTRPTIRSYFACKSTSLLLQFFIKVQRMRLVGKTKTFFSLRMWKYLVIHILIQERMSFGTFKDELPHVTRKTKLFSWYLNRPGICERYTLHSGIYDAIAKLLAKYWSKRLFFSLNNIKRKHEQT